MLTSYDDLSPERVAGLGFEDPRAAADRLQGLAGFDIPDERFALLLPTLSAALQATGDPDRALSNFSTWIDRVGNRSSYFALLTAHPAALNALVTILSVSQFFSDLLARYPELFEVIVNPLIRDAPRDADAAYRDAKLRIALARTQGAKRDALRRFKPAEILRIGARDLLGVATTEEVATEISGFAEACVRAAVDIAGAPDGFAVIALGKLGGRELNYASDIDLMFVHADGLSQAAAAAASESVTQSLERPTDAGFLFRTDLRLRPEGRFGPISRSVASCRAYYESWAEDWERQAMLKARCIAGDGSVGEEFLSIIEPFVYRRTVDAAFVASLRLGKQRIERRAALGGEGNVKEGRGGIRDVEFIVQALQLVWGGRIRAVRTGSTVEALRRLPEAGLMDSEAASELAEGYLFMRNVEHRLQIMDERPVRTLPLADARSLHRFARRLRYPDAPHFLHDYRRYSERTAGYLDRLFYGESAPRAGHAADNDDGGGASFADWVRDPADASRKQSALDWLSGAGFAHPDAALDSIEREVSTSDYGEALPQVRSLVAALAARLIDACAASGYPDDALSGMLALISAAPSPAALLSSLSENPALLVRLARLAGSAPRVWPSLYRYPELLDRLADEDLLRTPSQLAGAGPAPADPSHTAAYLRREQLRIAATDVWGIDGPQDVMSAIASGAEKSLQAALASAMAAEGYDKSEPDAPTPALIGLGKLGGAELGYSSDWDVLWIAPDGADSAVVKRIAERAMAFLSSGVKAHGVAVEVDARLRPEGRFGALVRTLQDYAEYFETRADPWERQVLIKARPIAGDLALGRKFVSTVASAAYGAPPDAEALAQIRHLKDRMERERAHSPADLKLGAGGLSDIEWTVQVLQWRHGKRWPKARTPGTLNALAALRDAAVIQQSDWDPLATAYTALYTARNRAWLRGVRGDCAESESTAEQLAPLRRRVREIFERLFLDRPPAP